MVLISAMDASLEWFSTPPLWHTKAVGGVHTINASARSLIGRYRLPRAASGALAAAIHGRDMQA
jgi:hypothetical protein